MSKGRGRRDWSKDRALVSIDMVVETDCMATKREIREAAAVLRRLLDAVDAGELQADGPTGSGLVRQMQGAIAALQAVARPPSGGRRGA